ncbi:carboxypeptidase-like regulatory domain-containing protein [Mucilaginibacter sp. UYCu711]|uniref:carboxypeptidase-like regulatory domain-containing protein n=1 Tax=Mucilaginibacter sp. UYCu711 TaxID=3156339 RepID=UPI003D25BCA2
MSAKRNDISQINKYLQGKLDAKAMHQLERDAHDDPFLMDALEGYEKAGLDQQTNLTELAVRIKKRIADEKKRSVLLWRVLPIAASVLIMLGAGYWFFKPKADKNQYANVVTVDSVQKSPVVKHLNNKPVQRALAKADHPKSPTGTRIVPKTDTVDTRMTIVNKAKKFEYILKKMEALKVDTNGLIAKNGQSVVGIRHNGENFSGAAAKTEIYGAKNQVIDTNYTYSGDPVVRGYVKRNKDLTLGSPYIITGKEVQDNPVGNVEQLLQGKVGGINVKNNTGAPGMRGTVNIRGLSAIDSSKWAEMAKDASKKYVTVSGEVKGIYGEALEGATIGAAGKGLTQVDANGKFTVTVPVDINTLVATNIGYKTQVIKIDKQTNLNIKLMPDDRSLSEVVIRGYVKRNRDETTGSSYIVTGKDAKKPTGAADNIGQGKVPGKFLPINPGPAAKEPATNSNCNENLTFKDRFFANIAIVEKHTIDKTGHHESTISYRRFLKALKFISKYARVSINLDKKSTTGYPDLQSFQTEKAEWLEWYEANKCNNLK